MTGQIFVRLQDGELRALAQEPYVNEDYFQELIAKHPELLAGDQITPDSPRQWVLVAREMGVPAEQDGGAQWSLDHLFIDQDAVPTFVEVKRSSDTRLRREVVAQMLDYAANGSQYWSLEDLRSSYEEQAHLADAGTLASIGVAPEREEEFWEQVSSNLRSGRLRLIFAADVIPPSLQRIIEFLNDQMTTTEVLGLEIKQYLSGDGLTTLVPDIVGATEAASQTKRRGSRQWDEASFLADTERLSGQDAVATCRRILSLVGSLKGRVRWGRGAAHGTLTPVLGNGQGHELFCVYNANIDVFVQILFQTMGPPHDTVQARRGLKFGLEQVPGVHLADDKLDKYPSFRIDLLYPEDSFIQFENVVRQFHADVLAFDQTNSA
ncbi:MAG: hypothetical protein FWD29_07030 [Micrococcales bacterium]|nr:hypothetical protein [Micrococcales bacterium]